jgi:phosphatidylglycerophosphate synthase
MLRTICALGRVSATVHVLRTAACPVSAVHELESEISKRELKPRIEWTDSTDSVPTENGLFVVAQPGVFDSRLCAELSAEARDDGAIIRCRRSGQEESPLWFAGKESAGPLVRHLAAGPSDAIASDSDLCALVRDYHPDGAVCEIISDERTRRMAEKKLFKGAGKATDSPVAKIDRNISGWLTRYLVRSSVTPNQVTVLNTLIGVGGAALILAGTYWAQVIGAVLLVLAVILDGCDGEVARLKFLESSFGRKLDFFLDNVVNVCAIFAAGAGYFLRSGEPLYLHLAFYTAALAAAAVWPVYALFFREDQKPAGVRKERPADAYSVAEGMQGRDFVYLILFLALIGKTHWFSLVASVGLTVFVSFVLILWGKRQLAHAGGAAA